MAEVTIPTEDQIRQLPSGAQVAFAARCARRAQRLFVEDWPDAPRKHLEAIENAIQVAENAAAQRDYTLTAVDTLGAAHAAARDFDHVAVAAVAAVDLAHSNYQVDTYAIEAARARSAAYAAYAAADAVYAATYSSAAYAARAAAYAVARAGVPISAIRGDFDFLLERSKREKWDDNTPVPPSVFPPLDAEPPEAEQPEPPAVMTAEELQADETIIGKIRFFGKPGTTAQELAPHIRSTYQALNQLTLAKYGKYLKLADFKRLVLQYAGVPQS